MSSDTNNNNPSNDPSNDPNNNPNPPLDEMTTLINFVNNRVITLCNIYVNERRSNGDGLLFLTIADSQPNGASREVKLFYQNDNELQPNVLNDLQNRRNNNSTDIIYFYLFTEDGKQNIVELDIRDHLGNNNRNN